ncbi:MAG: Uma2 family endonuclease [Actinobacteria bacterium]|nr:Uma2 family endonuclease [Actinomycetota bacterium]MCA1721536.1 Uma2 family endonuclease [Actinomycetota bacterium]
MAVVLPEYEGEWTWEEFVLLESETGERFELVDGALLVSPPPGNLHMAISRRLFRQLDAQCAPPLEAAFEVAVRIGRSARVPDLAVVRADAPVGHGIGYAPEHLVLAVEIVSPSSHTNDRLVKPAEYAAAGIPSYWRVETDGSVELVSMHLVGGVYAEQLRATSGVVQIGDWRIDVDALMSQ